MNQQEEAAIYKRLAAPFPLEDLEWRMQSTGKGKSAPGDKVLMLAYVRARAVFERLTDALGLGGWSTKHRQVLGGTITTRRFKSSHTEGWGSNRKEVPEDVEVVEREEGWVCRLSARIGDKWITHEDSSEETDVSALKGGFSKSLVRAAVRLGVGAYLYEMPKQWCTLEGSGDRGFVPRGWKPDISKIPPDCRPAKGGGRAATDTAPAHIVDHDEPPDDPKPITQPEPPGQPQPVGAVVKEMGVPTGEALECMKRLEAAMKLVPWKPEAVRSILLQPVDWKKLAEKGLTYAHLAEAAIRPDRKESGTYSSMEWVLERKDLKDRATDREQGLKWRDWISGPLYKRCLLISQWAEKVELKRNPPVLDPMEDMPDYGSQGEIP